MEQQTHMGGEGPVQATPVMKFDPKDIESNKLMAILSYIGILCLIPLFLKKDSAFVQEHAKQGFVLFLVEIAFAVVGYFPFIGFLSMIGSLITFVVSIIGIIKVLKGEFWEIPLIGSYRKMVKF